MSSITEKHPDFHKTLEIDEFQKTEVESLQLSRKSEVDEAFDIALQAQDIEVSEEQNARILRKIDLYIQPLMYIIYALQYMDKVTNSYAGVMGIQKDLNFKGNEFSWLGTAFYIAYLAAEFPVSQALQRLPFIKTMSVFIIIWGIILCCHAAATSAGGIIAARVFLGIGESAITPGFMILSSQYYKKSEQFPRIAIWFNFNGLGALMGGGIAYGLAHNASSLTIESWRVLFIVTGLMTCFFGVVFYFYVPANPAKAWFLTEEERLCQVQRIRSNQQGFGTKKFKRYQFIEAFKDIRTWIYIVWGIAACIPNGGLGTFGTILLNETLGYSKQDAILMGLPQGAVQLCAGVIMGYISNKSGKRVIVGVCSCCITVIGMFLLAFTNSSKAQLAGYYLIPFFTLGMVTILASIASDAAGHTKKLTVSAAFLVSYCIGNLIGPQTFVSKDAPGYHPQRVVMAACLVVATFGLFMLLIVNVLENRKRDKAFANDPNYYIAPENSEFLDLTDFENKNFRYSL